MARRKAAEAGMSITPAQCKAAFLCLDHMAMLRNDETGNYYHLDATTGELFDLEFGKYACDPECEVCAE
jgi:hypothetical protein